MYPRQIHQYIRQFFKENNCQVVQDTDCFIQVQLTIDMDKKIMNRPFYWNYVESTGGEPNPAQLTFITNPNELVEQVAGEIVHFGSPRLNQLFQVTKEQGAYIQMYEQADQMSATNTMLTPWLGANYKLTYCSDRTKEMLYSLGINLMTGAVVNGFQEMVRDANLEMTMSANTFHLPPTIQPLRALEKLDAVIDQLIQQDDHLWAEEAKKRERRDLRVLDYFYEGMEDRPDHYEREKQAIEERYETKIKVEIINGGLFYLKGRKVG